MKYYGIILALFALMLTSCMSLNSYDTYDYTRDSNGITSTHSYSYEETDAYVEDNTKADRVGDGFSRGFRENFARGGMLLSSPRNIVVPVDRSKNADRHVTYNEYDSYNSYDYGDNNSIDVETTQTIEKGKEKIEKTKGRDSKSYNAGSALGALVSSFLNEVIFQVLK